MPKNPSQPRKPAVNALLPDKPDYRLTRLKVENFMRVELAELKFTDKGELITIGGENGNGKSSVLKALETLLTGSDRKISRPVHEGAVESVNELEFGNERVSYIVQRTFDANGKTALRIVRSDDDSEIQSPAQFLNMVIASTFVDPLDFMAKQPIEMRNILLDLIELDTSGVDGEIQDTRDEVKSIERELIGLEEGVRGLPEYPDAPKERPTAGKLAEELDTANRDLLHWEQVERDCVDAMNRVANLTFEANQIDEEVKRLQEKSSGLRARAKQIEDDGLTRLPAGYDQFLNDAKERITKFKEGLATVETLQSKFDANDRKAKARHSWETKENLRVACQQKLAKLIESKKQMLAEAKFPTPGLGFDETGVTYNGVPFNQASAAEQIRVSMEIALAKKGRLAPIIVRDGSILDNKMLQIIAAIAKEKGAQVFVETVANRKEDGSYDRECSFIVEEGRIAQ